MKFQLSALVVAALAVSPIVAQQGCKCEPTDTECISKCVTGTNDCVTQCKNDNACYQQCVKGWPGVGEEPSPSSSVAADGGAALPTSPASGGTNPGAGGDGASSSDGATPSGGPASSDAPVPSGGPVPSGAESSGAGGSSLPSASDGTAPSAGSSGSSGSGSAPSESSPATQGGESAANGRPYPQILLGAVAAAIATALFA